MSTAALLAEFDADCLDAFAGIGLSDSARYHSAADAALETNPVGPLQIIVQRAEQAAEGQVARLYEQSLQVRVQRADLPAVPARGARFVVLDAAGSPSYRLRVDAVANRDESLLTLDVTEITP